MKLPNEEDEKIQEILKCDTTLERKARRIFSFYKSKIPYNRVRGSKDEQPPIGYLHILIELEKRGEDLTPIDIELIK